MTREAEQREKRLRDDMEQPGVNKSNKSSPSRYEPRSRRGGVYEFNCTTMAEKAEDNCIRGKKSSLSGDKVAVSKDLGKFKNLNTRIGKIVPHTFQTTERVFYETEPFCI